MINRSRTVKAPVPPLLEPLPNFKGSTTLDELCDVHMEQLVAFLQKDPNASPTPLELLESFESSAACEAEDELEVVHRSEVEEHNPYLDPLNYPDEANGPHRDVIIPWGEPLQIQEQLVDVRNAAGEADVTGAKVFWRRDDLLSWQTWKHMWLDMTTRKQRILLAVALLLGWFVAGLLVVTNGSPKVTPERPKAALKLVNARLQMLEQHNIPRSSQRQARQWLKKLERDRQERSFLRKFQSQLVERLLTTSDSTKRMRKLFELLSTRFVRLEQQEEQSYEKLQHLTRYTSQSYLKRQTRQVLNQIKRDKDELRFLRKLQKILFDR